MSATFVWLPDVAEPDAPTERLMKVTPASASQIHRMPPPPEVYRTSRSILSRPSTVIAIAESKGVTDDVTLWSAACSTRSGMARWSASAVSRCPARYWSAMLCSLQREVDGLRPGYGRARGVGLHDAVDGPLDGHEQIGRAHVWTPVTNAHLVCRLLLAKKKKNKTQKSAVINHPTTYIH